LTLSGAQLGGDRLIEESYHPGARRSTMSDTQKQTIVLEYVASAAQKEADKFARDEQARTKASASVAAQAAKAQAEAWKAALKEQSDADKNYRKMQSDAARAAARDMAASAKGLTDAEKKEQAERRAVQAVADRFALRDYKDRVRQQAAAANQLKNDEIKAAEAAAAAHKKALAETAKGFNSQNAAIMGGVKSMGMFALSMAGVSSASAVLSKVVEHFNAVRMAAIMSGDDLIKYAKELRSLGALEGNLGSPEKTLVSQLAFRMKTLQTPGDAAEMTKAAMASAQGAIDSGIVDPAVFKSFLTSQGQLQNMLGESPHAIGNVAGSIPMMMGHKGVKLEEMQAMSEKARLLAKGGGFESYEQAGVQLGKVMPWVTSGMLSMPEAMTLLSVEAHGGQGAEAGTRIDEMIRMTSMGAIRAKKMKLDPSVADDAQVSSEYMKSIGIEKNTSSYNRIKKIAEDLVSQEKAAVAGGDLFDPIRYLGTKGQINMGSNYAAAHMFGQMRIGAFEPLEAEANKVQDPNAQTKAFEHFVATSTTAQRILSDVGVEMTQMMQGLQAGEPWKKTMMRQAYTSLGPKEMNRPFDEIYNAGITDPVGIGKRSILGREAQRMILEEADLHGVKHPKLLDFGLGRQGEFSWDALERISERSAAAGGSMVPAVSTAKMEELLRSIDQKLGAQGGSPAAPAAKGAAPLQPAVPGIAPVLLNAGRP
jgi:hypothetical protein